MFKRMERLDEVLQLRRSELHAESDGRPPAASANTELQY